MEEERMKSFGASSGARISFLPHNLRKFRIYGKIFHALIQVY